MKCKINIIEPWESGTDKAIEADILMYSGTQFLIFVEKTIKVNGVDAHYFICKLQVENSGDVFEKKKSGMYKISMVFDKNINNVQQPLPNIDSYRGNFLIGELII